MDETINIFNTNLQPVADIDLNLSDRYIVDFEILNHDDLLVLTASPVGWDGDLAHSSVKKIFISTGLIIPRILQILHY